MTKKEVVEGLSKYSDDDVVYVTDGRSGEQVKVCSIVHTDETDYMWFRDAENPNEKVDGIVIQ